MIKSFYEEPIFSSDFQRKDLQVIDKSIQQLLDKNNGVGVVGGFYTPGLPVGIISELALRSLGCHGDEVFGSGYTMQFADCFAEDCDLRDLENFRQFKGKRTLVRRCAAAAAARRRHCQEHGAAGHLQRHPAHGL